MRQINIKTIPHSEQRYPTVGDYWIDEVDVLQIRVSDMGNARYEELVAVHELNEALLVLARGIPIELIDKFDMQYEASRSEWDTVSEPGDAAGAPYRIEHFFATNVERLLAREYSVDWKAYEDKVTSL